MAELKIRREYRTYRFKDKNPVIDKVRTLIQDEGLFTKLGIVHQLSGVATSTLNGWFHGDTISPQHHTVAAVVTSLGYEETFARVKALELDSELQLATKWLEKQSQIAKRAKPNNRRKAK